MRLTKEERSVVLVDWSRLNEPTATNRNSLLYEMMLLSLVYDQVLVQDEVFMVSHKLSRWFQGSHSFGFLEELLDTGSVVLLKRPLSAYPMDLRDLAQDQPVTGRKLHLQKFSVNNDGKPITFTSEQEEFHSRLEACLRRSQRAHRPAGRVQLAGGLMHAFGERLTHVLNSPDYAAWRQSRFGKGREKEQMWKDFVKYVGDPDAAIHRVRSKGQQPKYTPTAQGPIFNTALAVQVAATYPLPQAHAMQGVIETVFAVPFCESEDAAGRYGPALRELPLPLKREDGDAGLTRVSVEAEVRIPIGLPQPKRGFGRILQKVRNGSGKDLRKAMGQLDTDPNFRYLSQAWQAVADDLASQTMKMGRKVNVRTVVGHICGAAMSEAFVDWVHGHPPQSVEEAVSWLPAKLAGPTLAIGGGLLYRALRADLKRQEISEKLVNAVQFRCVKIPSLVGN
jgi:hypothetical protein